MSITQHWFSTKKFYLILWVIIKQALVLKGTLGIIYVFSMTWCTIYKNPPVLLVSTDFEKAFDSTNWAYMHGFGENICLWISSFYTNTHSSVIVNGKASRFATERSCRQGDQISPYVFILCAEVLASKIREDKEIKGIPILDIVFKISRFANDTSLILEGDKSYEKHFWVLREYENILGLKLNY